MEIGTENEKWERRESSFTYGHEKLKCFELLSVDSSRKREASANVVTQSDWENG